MARQQIDYDKLAREHGGTPVTPGPVDYDALAREAGGTPAGPARAEDFLPPAPEGSALGRFVWELGGALNPVTMAQGLYGAVRHPLQTGQGIIAAGVSEAEKAAQAAREGRYSEMAGHGLAAALPVLGPAAAAVGEQIGGGDVAGGLGAATGLVGGTLAPSALARRGVPLLAAQGRNVPAAVAEAVQFGLREGIPVDPATATGSRYLRGVQRLVGKTLGGSVAEEPAIARQQVALEAAGRRVAGQVAPVARTAEEAGEAAVEALKARARALKAQADVAYDELRAIEARQKALIRQSGGHQAPATHPRPFTAVPLAVDLAPTKAAMRPIYQALKREAELVPLMGGRARMLTVLDTLMDAPDLAPLSQADRALSELKSLARVSDDFRRTGAQGIAAKTVANLDAAVRAAAQHPGAGPDAFRALMRGRAATVNKYKTIELLDAFGDDALGAFTKATSPTKIAQLRELARVAPGEVRLMGRAWLERALTKATQEGGFQRPEGLIRDWQRLNPQAKALLFGGPAHVKDLDDLFLLAKKLAENPNPSGSAFTAAQGAELAGLGTAAVAVSPWALLETLGTYGLGRALYSPRVTRVLLRGLRLPPGATTARAAWAAQVGRLLEAEQAEAKEQ